jgi:hypothetical protein
MHSLTPVIPDREGDIDRPGFFEVQDKNIA